VRGEGGEKCSKTEACAAKIEAPTKFFWPEERMREREIEYATKKAPTFFFSSSEVKKRAKTAHRKDS